MGRVPSPGPDRPHAVFAGRRFDGIIGREGAGRPRQDIDWV
jgi:hypothetical protein